jgi:hypothetical protein
VLANVSREANRERTLGEISDAAMKPPLSAGEVAKLAHH